jgi:hypothetical protein
MTGHARISSRSVLRAWIVAAVSCALVAALIYGMLPMDGAIGFKHGLEYFLFPGVAAYTLLNGSLLFGGGFWDIGNFLIIVLGSALAWSLVIVLMGQVLLWIRHHRGREQ